VTEPSWVHFCSPVGLAFALVETGNLEEVVDVVVATRPKEGVVLVSDWPKKTVVGERFVGFVENPVAVRT